MQKGTLSSNLLRTKRLDSDTGVHVCRYEPTGKARVA